MSQPTAFVTQAPPTTPCSFPHTLAATPNNPEAISVSPMLPPYPGGARQKRSYSRCQTSPAFTAEPAKPSNPATFNHSLDKLNLSTSLAQYTEQSELTIKIMPTTNKTKLHTATAAVDDPGGGDGVGFLIHIEALHRDCTGILDLEQNQVDEDVLCGKLTTLSACPPPWNLIEASQWAP